MDVLDCPDVRPQLPPPPDFRPTFSARTRDLFRQKMKRRSSQWLTGEHLDKLSVRERSFLYICPMAPCLCINIPEHISLRRNKQKWEIAARDLLPYMYALQACKNAKQFEKQSTDMGISVATMT